MDVIDQDISGLPKHQNNPRVQDGTISLTSESERAYHRSLDIHPECPYYTATDSRNGSHRNFMLPNTFDLFMTQNLWTWSLFNFFSILSCNHDTQ